MFSRRSRDKADWVRGLLETYERPLLRYALRLVKNPQTAKDVVQDTFLRLWATDIGEVERPAEWLYTVCRNSAFDVLRKGKRMKAPQDAQELEQVPDEAPSASRVLELRQAQSRILSAMARLPENQQEVVRLKFQSGLSYKEISRVTGLSESNVGFLLHTALNAIRERVEEKDSGVASAGGGQ